MLQMAEACHPRAPLPGGREGEQEERRRPARRGRSERRCALGGRSRLPRGAWSWPRWARRTCRDAGPATREAPDQRRRALAGFGHSAKRLRGPAGGIAAVLWARPGAVGIIEQPPAPPQIHRYP